MLLTISNENKEVITFQIISDQFGNIYFRHSNSIYQLNVDGKNNIYFEKYNEADINKINQKIGKFTNLNDTSLRAKVKQEKEKYKYQLDDIDEDDEDDENYYDDTYNKYYLENSNILIDENCNDESEEFIDEENNKNFGEGNKKFNFYSSVEHIVDIHDIEKIAALYDTYIYNIHDQLIFKSNSRDNESLYILKIYASGKIFFRPIGAHDKQYKLIINNNELKCIN